MRLPARVEAGRSACALRPARAAAACIALVCSAASADAPFRFLVRADPGAAAPRCRAADAARCRDDLTLTQVFEALDGIAAGSGRWPFEARADGRESIAVELGRGVFRLPRALLLSGWNASGRWGTLTIRGADGGASVLSGAVPIDPSAWRPVPEGETRVAPQARAHVKVADISASLGQAALRPRPASGFGEPIVPLPMQLLADGRPLPLARWPNDGWARTAAPQPAAPPRATDAPARSIEVRAPDAAGANAKPAPPNTAAWASEPDLMVAGYLAYDWAFERIPVRQVDRDSGRIALAGSGARFGVRDGRRIVVENALAELDAPGEWYFDRQRRVVYFWPPADAAAVEVATTTTLVEITRSAKVRLERLRVEATTGDAIVVRDSSDVVVADTALHAIGNRGIVVEGGSAVALRRLALSDLGDGGVLLSGGDRRTLAPARHSIEDSTIERFSRISRSYRPAVAVYGVGIRVLRNRIADGPHSAIVFDGNDHLIEGNHISDVVTETNDAGAIYTGRDWTARGTVIANNLMQNVYARVARDANVMGVYLDDQASGVTVARNVFANVTRAVFIGGGRDNVVEGNLFVASSPAVFADDRGTSWQKPMVDDAAGELRRRLGAVPYAAEPYRSRYPRLAALLDDEPGRIKYNRIDGNLFVASRPYEWAGQAQAGVELARNHEIPWSAFTTLKGPRPRYAPADFELVEAALPETRTRRADLARIPR